jgi:putative salt-induced outer membrane protein
MARSVGALFAFALVVLPAAAHAAPIPPPILAMIDAAADDAGKLAVVAEIAKRTNPDSAAEIDARVAFIRDDDEKVRMAHLGSLRFRQGWTGQGEAGGSLATGNTEESGVTLGLNLAKETIYRRHRITALIDAKTAGGVQTTERYAVGYQGDYKITDRVYSNLLAGWERDPFAGIEQRFSESMGVGYRFLPGGRMTLDADIGVAARQTWYSDGALNDLGQTVEGGEDSTLGLRFGGRYEWRIGPDSLLTQTASAYLDSRGESLESATALTTKLIGQLSWRASLNLRYESDPPPPRKTTDTLTRFSLVYAF